MCERKTVDHIAKALDRSKINVNSYVSLFRSLAQVSCPSLEKMQAIDLPKLLPKTEVRTFLDDTT
jgi:hypothetical protein